MDVSYNAFLIKGSLFSRIHQRSHKYAFKVFLMALSYTRLLYNLKCMVESQWGRMYLWRRTSLKENY